MPDKAQIEVDFSTANGVIRRLNGGNLGPRLYRPDNQIAEFRELEIPCTRLHDAPLGNYGLKLVDIHQIFANFKADAQDPDNYYFRQTDDYLREIHDAGSDIVYRLGTSIEHTKVNYFAYPPADFNKWTDICIHIIRHYNEGWNNGFNWNIRYWEIWNEPDGGGMWNASRQEYFKLYEIAAKRIKERFPGVKVGGPALCSIHGAQDHWGDDFLAFCRDRHLPLDFYSWHNYGRDPEAVIHSPVEAREFLDSYGFRDTELHLNEWHYWNGWGKELEQGPYRMNSLRAAVHALAVLTGWQDTPLTMGNFYTIGYLDWMCSWGVWNSGAYPNPLFHAFKMFAETARHPDRVASSSSDKNVRVLAGLDKDGSGVILLSDFVSECDTLSLAIRGASADAVEIVRLDGGDGALTPVRAEVCGGVIELPTPRGESSAYLIRNLKTTRENAHEQ